MVPTGLYDARRYGLARTMGEETVRLREGIFSERVPMQAADIGEYDLGVEDDDGGEGEEKEDGGEERMETLSAMEYKRMKGVKVITVTCQEGHHFIFASLCPQFIGPSSLSHPASARNTHTSLIE